MNETFKDIVLGVALALFLGWALYEYMWLGK